MPTGTRTETVPEKPAMTTRRKTATASEKNYNGKICNFSIVGPVKNLTVMSLFTPSQ